MLRRTCPLILSFCSKYRTLYIVGSSFLLLYGYSRYSMSDRLPLCLLWLLFKMYWALCLSSLGCDLFAPRSPQWIALPPGDKHKAQYISLKALPQAAQKREDQAGRHNRETAPQAQTAPVEAPGASSACICSRPAVPPG